MLYTNQLEIMVRERCMTADRIGPRTSVAPLPLRRGGRLRAVHQ